VAKTYSNTLQEKVSLMVFERMFLDTPSLILFIRMAEHCKILLGVLRSLVKAYSKSQISLEPMFDKIDDFLKTLPDYTLVEKYINPNQSYVKLDVMECRGNKHLNAFVLKEWTSWGPVHSIDLSYTDITDEILQIVLSKTAGYLVSLQLKGCNFLTQLSMSQIIMCKKLHHLSLWNADEDSLLILAEKTQISYLDLSYCRQLSPRVITKLNGQIYLDLSFAAGINPSDRQCFSKWAKQNKNLQALVIRGSSLAEDNNQAISNIINDDILLDVLSYTGSSLKLLDIMNCNELTYQSIIALSKHCTNLEIFGICYYSNRADSDQVTVTGDHFKSICINLPQLKEIEIVKRVAENIKACMM